MPSPTKSSFSETFLQLGRDLAVCLQFYSRLPIRTAAWTMAELATGLRLAPLAGAIVGLLGGMALLVAGTVLALPTWLAATLAVTILVLSSGGLHEDGLADVADGFGGGSSVERKLDIMKDSRIGTFGTLALILSMGARIGAIAAIARLYGYGGGAAALVAAGASSRGLGLLPLAVLAPARAAGLGQGIGRLASKTLTTAIVLAAVACLLPTLFGIPLWRPTLAGLCALAAAFGMTWLAKRQIGGQTGDVAGAAQQLCEIAYLLGLLIASEGS